jgi:hypothetical protein
MSFLFALGGLVLLSGCGDGSSKLVPVSGKVTINGKPLTSGWVSLRPDKSKGNTFGGEPMGEVNAQGEYTIQTNGQPGAPLGAYKVVVSSTGATTEDNTKVKAQSLVNPTYLHPDITPLKIEVVETATAGAYDLKLSP